MTPEEESPGRTLAAAASAMAVVAVLVGLVVGGVVLAVASYAGVDDAVKTRARQAPQSLYIPKYRPTTSAADDGPRLTYSPSPVPSIPSPTETPSTPVGRAITLFVAPQSVAPGQRINFNGVYNGAEGAILQIQRKEAGAWTDFPVTATVRGGAFETWITTERAGRSTFRVLDARTGRASKPVTVTIG